MMGLHASCEHHFSSYLYQKAGRLKITHTCTSLSLSLSLWKKERENGEGHTGGKTGSSAGRTPGDDHLWRPRSRKPGSDVRRLRHLLVRRREEPEPVRAALLQRPQLFIQREPLAPARPKPKCGPQARERMTRDFLGIDAKAPNQRTQCKQQFSSSGRVRGIDAASTARAPNLHCNKESSFKRKVVIGNASCSSHNSSVRETPQCNDKASFKRKGTASASCSSYKRQSLSKSYMRRHPDHVISFSSRGH